jgi:hypothetical protein
VQQAAKRRKCKPFSDKQYLHQFHVHITERFKEALATPGVQVHSRKQLQAAGKRLHDTMEQAAYAATEMQGQLRKPAERITAGMMTNITARLVDAAVRGENTIHNGIFEKLVDETKRRKWTAPKMRAYLREKCADDHDLVARLPTTPRSVPHQLTKPNEHTLMKMMAQYWMSQRLTPEEARKIPAPDLPASASTPATALAEMEDE